MSGTQSALIGAGGNAWVSGTTYAIGNQVVSPTDFNLYVRKTNGSGVTDPSSDSTNWQPSSTGIKSIQRGTISLAVGAATATATLSPSVNTAKSELRYTGFYGTTGDSIIAAHLFLTNGTTVTATKANATNIGSSVSFEVTERY